MQFGKKRGEVDIPVLMKAAIFAVVVVFVLSAALTAVTASKSLTISTAITYLTSQGYTAYADSGGNWTVTGGINQSSGQFNNFNGNRLSGIGTPTNASDATTKSYVDNADNLSAYSAYVIASDAPQSLKDAGNASRANGMNVWVVTGTADDEIQAAISSLPLSDVHYPIGIVRLSVGTFYISSSILIPTGVIRISGSGSGTDAASVGKITILYASNNFNSDMIKANSTVANKRVLYLSDLAMYGNKNNNIIGNGINLDYMDLGGHYENGLENVFISQFAENGIKATTTAYLSANSFVITGCGQDGINSSFVQGWQIGLPNWFIGNDGWGVYLTGYNSDNVFDLYIEDNSKGGGYFDITNSVIKIWSKSNSWEGINIVGDYNQIIANVARNGQSVSGNGVAADIVFSNAIGNQMTVNTNRNEQLVANISGLYFTGTCVNNSISGKISASGYALYFNSAPNMIGTYINIMQDCLQGTSSLSVQATESTGVLLDLRGVEDTGSSFFAIARNPTIGSNNSYGSVKQMYSSSGYISSFEIGAVISGLSVENITIKYEVSLRGGSVPDYIERTYNTSGTYFLSDADKWELLDGLVGDYHTIRQINVYAKSDTVAVGTVSIKFISGN